MDEHAIVATTDPQGRITYVNDKFCAISQYSREELIGQDHRIIKSGIHSKEFMRNMWTTISNGKVWQGEFKNRAKDGSYYWVYSTIFPFLGSDGKPRQYVSIRTDITGCKQTEAGLREREQQLRLYTEHSPAAIAMFDRDMNYLVASVSWVEGYGYGSDAASIIGRNHYEIFPDMPQRWREGHQRCLAGAVEKCDEESIPQPDGTPRWIRWEVRPWEQADGSIGGIIIFTEDITTRKLAEEKTQAQLAELQRWQEAMLNREDRVQSLKAEVNTLLIQQKQSPRYSIPPDS